MVNAFKDILDSCADGRKEIIKIDSDTAGPTPLSLRENAIYWADSLEGLNRVEDLTKAGADVSLASIYTHPFFSMGSTSRDSLCPGEQYFQQWNAFYAGVIALHKQTGVPVIKFETDDAEQCLALAARLFIDLGLDPDMKKISGTLQHLLSNKESMASVPVTLSCRDTFAYLEKHNQQCDHDELSHEILQLKMALIDHPFRKPEDAC